ncbi:MAG TPA: flagellar basal body-associated FliL family protein [Steroidobacteraceae bacterium]
MSDVPVLAPAQEAPAAAAGRRKWLIIGSAAFVVLAGAGVGTWMLWPQPASHAGKAEKPQEPLAPPLYAALDPPFVVNFNGEQSARFLQVAVQVMTRDPATVELLKANDPVVRNDLLLLFGNQKVDVVSTREGKEHLRADALAAVRNIVAGAGGHSDHVEAVYFTSFVMQ